jgi:hypothetical protein
MQRVVMTMIQVLVLVMTTETALASGGTDVFNIAWETKQNIDARLAECGTSRLNPDDPRLPFRQVPAHEALANLEIPWFFGYFYRTGGEFMWKWPNGGSYAWMQVQGDGHLSFSTTYAGQVAWMNKFYTPWGERFNYWCRSVQVDYAGLEACVEAYWVQPLLNGFCRS